MEKPNQYISILGIMACQIKKALFYEKGFYQFLQKFGNDQRILVYVFYPNSVDWKNRKVKGYHYNFSTKQWAAQWFPLPDYIYDRCFYSNSKQFNLYKPYIQQLKSQNNITFLGNGLTGKWEVQQILSKNSKIQAYLPRTEIYKGLQQLFLWLNQYPVVLKPVGGSHGKGVIKISKENKQFEVIGRTATNDKIRYTFPTYPSFSKWINQFIYRKNYLIQQYLDLTTNDSKPYDIRILIQKNKEGVWEETGMAARLGDKDTITSNLHGGGTVTSPYHILQIEHGDKKANELLQKLDHLSKYIPPYLEKYHGALFELGLDVGVDKQGNVWIIEVNSKPGRSVFTLLNNQALVYKSRIQPIMYTLFLSKKKVGGKVI